MGYCASVSDVLDFTDCFVFPSLQEGLPVAVLEAMRAGVPVIASNIRGNSDLIQNEKGGYLVKRNSAEEYADRIIDVVTEPVKARKYGEFNKERIKAYEKSIVAMKMKKLYSECLK